MATKMTYGEQLKHPNWQRKRLGVLDAAGFKCVACGCGDKMLHVHHKLYVKGRMAWDYADSELEALCEDCHKEAHDHKELLDGVISCFPSVTWISLMHILAGYGDAYFGINEATEGSTLHVNAGRIAYALVERFNAGQMAEFADRVEAMSPDDLLDAVRAAKAEEA